MGGRRGSFELIKNACHLDQSRNPVFKPKVRKMACLLGFFNIIYDSVVSLKIQKYQVLEQNITQISHEIGTKIDRVVSMGVPNNRSHVRTSPVTCSIRDLFKEINREDVI